MPRRANPPKSEDEKRWYSRGYNRAGTRSWDRVKRVLEVAKGYRSRLSDISADRTCATCDRWLRGAGMNNSEKCQWGSCRADFEWGLEGRMWVDMPLGTPKQFKPQITTSQDFGCSSWLPLTTLRAREK